MTPVLGIVHDLQKRRAALDSGNAGKYVGDPSPPEHVHLIFAASSHAELALLDCSLLADARCARIQPLFAVVLPLTLVIMHEAAGEE